MSKLITAQHLAEREGRRSVSERIYQHSRELARRNLIAGAWSGKVTDAPVRARVDFGRWIADCECGGAEYVDPEQPVFFCMSCGNAANSGHARPVEFPDEAARMEIEELLLERPVDDGYGHDAAERAFRARPQAPGLSRSWNPDESARDLRRQNRAAGLTKARM